MKAYLRLDAVPVAEPVPLLLLLLSLVSLILVLHLILLVSIPLSALTCFPQELEPASGDTGHHLRKNRHNQPSCHRQQQQHQHVCQLDCDLNVLQ